MSDLPNAEREITKVDAGLKSPHQVYLEATSAIASSGTYYWFTARVGVLLLRWRLSCFGPLHWPVDAAVWAG
jgi:hypothetical protein